jgi:hypothetical protein
VRNSLSFAEGAMIEGEFLEGERAGIRHLAAMAPADADAFLAWFDGLRETGPGQNDPLFPWLATSASLAEMKWFLTQEVAGEAGFDDLTALTQVRLPARVKLELARNYWDEMGRGKPKGMHGPLLETLAARLGLEPRVETTVREALALANTMAGLAANRRYAFHSIGALGVIEMTAPNRSAAVATGRRSTLFRPTLDPRCETLDCLELRSHPPARRGTTRCCLRYCRRCVDAAGVRTALL